MKTALAVAVGMLLPLPLMAGQEKTVVPAGTPVTITVTPAAAADPVVKINLGGRHGHVTPTRHGFAHTGGGNIDVQQPSADTLVITMTGVAVAGGHPFRDSVASMAFDLSQCFEITYDTAKVKKAKLTIEGRVIGLLRSECKGKSSSAGFADACAAVNGCALPGLSWCVEPHSVSDGDSQSVNCTAAPVNMPIVAGQYTLHETFTIVASHARGSGKAASAEFAPDPALDPLWISYYEPFHGAAKKDFGFQVTIKVADDTEPAPEPVPPPTEKKP